MTKLQTQIEFEEAFNRPSDELENQALGTTAIVEQLSTEFYTTIQEVSELKPDTILSGMFDTIATLGDAYLSKAIVDHKGEVVRSGRFTPSHVIQIIKRAFNCDTLTSANILEKMNGVLFDALEEVDENGKHVGAIIDVQFVVLEAQSSLMGKTPLPLTIEPKPYEDFEEGGYYTETASHGLMLNNSESQWDTDLTAVNHFMKTTWVIRHDLFDEVDYCEYLYNKAVADYKEPPANITKELRQNASRTASMVASRINCFDDGERVHFSWRRDSRGRYYAVGWGISPQSDGYMRGVLQPMFD